MALIGIIVFSGITQMMLHKRVRQAPVRMVAGSSTAWSAVDVSSLAM